MVFIHNSYLLLSTNVILDVDIVAEAATIRLRHLLYWCNRKCKRKRKRASAKRKRIDVSVSQA
jgi:hypothetical protein